METRKDSSSCWNEEQHVSSPGPGWMRGAGGAQSRRQSGWTGSEQGEGLLGSMEQRGIAEAGRGQGMTMTKLSKWFG